ncbi:MAG: DUF2061 domain-containing protein [Rhodobacteraceae bacterium]|jgi:uncharacterized membrane protein|nr:DUF2061 domain-containing protein [Paracoccaceae bacterium]
METRRRTLAKAAGWQVLGLAVMTAAGALVTGSVTLGGGLAALNAGLGLLLYFGYERLWAGIAWGRR